MEALWSSYRVLLEGPFVTMLHFWGRGPGPEEDRLEVRRLWPGKGTGTGTGRLVRKRFGCEEYDTGVRSTALMQSQLLGLQSSMAHV